MPECAGECSGMVTYTKRIPVGKCANVGKPPAGFITDAIAAAIEDAGEDCAEGCECIIDSKRTVLNPPGGKCTNTPKGHKWTITVTVFGECKAPAK